MVMQRIYSNRQPQGPSYNFDQRLTAQQPTPVPGGLGGVLTFPGIQAPQMDTGRLALSALAIAVIAVVGFNVWTRAYQA